MEFREPESDEYIFSKQDRVEVCNRSRVVELSGYGRRRWILKRKETEQVEPVWLPVVETNKPILDKPMKEQASFKQKLKSLLLWSVAPPALIAKHATLKSNWIGWACMAAAVSWYAWLASTGQVEVPTLQWPLKW